jgi:hypothetical protein
MRWAVLGAGLAWLGLVSAASAGLSVAQYQESYAALKKAETVQETERSAYMQAHRAELDTATQMQERAAMAYETLLEADDAAFEHYGRHLLCNFDEEEQRITFKDLVDEFVAELHAQNLSGAEIASTLRMKHFAAVLMDGMFDHYRCPASAALRR